MPNKLYRLYEAYRERGFSGAFAKAVRFFYDRERVIISGRGIDPRDFPELRHESPPDVQCIVLEKPEALDPFWRDIPSSFRDSAQKLRQRLVEGCILFLAKKDREDDAGDEIIGYSLAQRGVFSALGRKARISPDTLFIHYIEVLPTHRRRGVTKAIVRARYEYCKGNGIAQTVAVGSTRNRLSERAFRRSFTTQRLGLMQKVSILGGLYVWETPWEKIHKALFRLTTRVASDSGTSVGSPAL